MGIIAAGFPEELPCKDIELAAACARREDGAGKRNVALQHAREAVLDLGGRAAGADPDGARHVGRAVGVLPAAVAQVDRRGVDAAVGLFARLVMHDRAVRPGARDGVETEIEQLAGFRAERPQLVRCRNFGQSALGCLDRDPVEVTAERGAVARLRGPLACLFDLVLDGLRQHRRVARLDDVRAALVQRVEDRDDRTVRIVGDFLAAQLAEHRRERLTRMQADAIAQMLAHRVVDLFRRDEQVGGRIGVQDGKAQRHWSVRHIVATHVERPGDRIERGHHRRVEALFGQPVGDLRTLVGRGTAGELVRLHFQLGG